MRASHFSTALVALLLAMPAAAQPLFDLVRTTYVQYAWVPLFGVTEAGQASLSMQPLPVLKTVFVADLAAAIDRDRRAMSRAGPGTLDFDILFASQDPVARDLELKSDGAHAVTACFTDAASTRICLTFVGRAEQGGMRIHDIVYDNGRFTLRGQLGLKR
jgi:hypothetical protein